MLNTCAAVHSQGIKKPELGSPPVNLYIYIYSIIHLVPVFDNRSPSSCVFSGGLAVLHACPRKRQLRRILLNARVSNSIFLSQLEQHENFYSRLKRHYQYTSSALCQLPCGFFNGSSDRTSGAGFTVWLCKLKRPDLLLGFTMPLFRFTLYELKEKIKKFVLRYLGEKPVITHVQRKMNFSSTIG